MIVSTGFLVLLLAVNQAFAAYEDRRSELTSRVAQAYVADHCDPEVTPESELDQLPFTTLNNLPGVPVLDNPNGWSIKARVGGRPFLCLDDIVAEGQPFEPNPDGFKPPNDETLAGLVQDHFEVGKTVNRLWFTHLDRTGGFPVVIVLTPDGFLNVGGSSAPRLQGSAARLGFIGETFGINDYIQHADRLEISVVDDNTLSLLFDIDSQAGVGVIELTLHWNADKDEPEILAKAAHLSRFDATLGFAGFNFLRGPTLAETNAFHDGRNAFLIQPGQAGIRHLLVPPLSADDVVREVLASDVAANSKLILDQPQEAVAYFSKFPGTPYEYRADLTLTLRSSMIRGVSLQRAQKAVDLGDVNPEANETTNLFFSVPMTTNTLAEFKYDIGVAADQFDQCFPPTQAGVVYLASNGTEDRLEMLELDEGGDAIGPAKPLTDAAVVEPSSPSTSSDGRQVAFEANADGRRNIFVFDLDNGAIRRLTSDPFGSSDDQNPSFSPDDRKIAFSTNRTGRHQLNIESSLFGLNAGYGAGQVLPDVVTDADWSPTRNEIAVVTADGLRVFDLYTQSLTDVVLATGIAAPEYSPDGERMAFQTIEGVHVVDRDGSSERLVLAGADSPTWLDDGHLIVVMNPEGESDLFRLDIDTLDTMRLTPIDGMEAKEPAFAAVRTDTGPAGLFASTLPTSRGLNLDEKVGVFATIINATNETAEDCRIRLATDAPVSLDTFTTNATDNTITGTANAPVDIEAPGMQSYLLQLETNHSFSSREIAFEFDCSNILRAPVFTGVNTVSITSEEVAAPDIVALASTVSGDGQVLIAMPGETGAFAIASINLGPEATFTVTPTVDASPSNANLHVCQVGGLSVSPPDVTLMICETDSATAQCLSGSGSDVTTTIAQGETPTFSVFVTANAEIPLDPANNRIFVRFTTPSGGVAGSTSVSVTTTMPD